MKTHFSKDVESLLGPSRADRVERAIQRTLKPKPVNLPRAAGADPQLLAEKIKLTVAQSEKIAIQNAQARGELLPAASVEKEWSNILRDLRAAMLAIPTRLAQRLPHLTAHDVSLLDEEIRAVLAELVDHSG